MTLTAEPITSVSKTSTSVRKALGLLDAFRDGTHAVGVSEISRRAGIPKSTAFRLLATLEECGFVERVGPLGTDYQLTWRVFELGNRVEHCVPRGLRDIALPYMSELWAAHHRAVHLAALAGDEVVILEKIHGHQAGRLLMSTIGGRTAAHRTSLGKAILAFSSKETVDAALARPLAPRTQYSLVHPGQLVHQLHQAQREGVAYDREESTLGLTSVAAPILRHRRAVAAISISSPTSGFSEGLAEAVKTAARGITNALRALDLANEGQ